MKKSFIVNKIKPIVFYLIGFSFILAVKFFYRQAGCGQLRWILAPAAWWAGILGGISFEYIPQTGYVSHSFRFIIAPSCSGIQFMSIAAALLIFSFLHLMKTKKSKLCWVGISLIVSYLYTIMINGFRIASSIHFPLYLRKTGFFRLNSRWITPERFHTLLGTLIYFSALIVLYQATDYIIRDRLSVKNPDTGNLPKAKNSWWIGPISWYLGTILGIPLLNHACKNNIYGFSEYTAVILPACLAVLCLFQIIKLLRKSLHSS